MDLMRHNPGGVENTEGNRLVRMYFEENPRYGQPPREFPPHYIDTTQQPEDKPDYSYEKSSLFWGIAMYVAVPFLAGLCAYLYLPHPFRL